MFVVVLVAALVALCAAEPQSYTRESIIGGLSAEPQSFTMTREELRAGAVNSFQHARALMGALASKQRTFEVKDYLDVRDTQSWKLETFEDTLDKGYYSAITKYTMHPAEEVSYVNYDSSRHHSANSFFKSKSSRHLEHCATSAAELEGSQIHKQVTGARPAVLVASTFGAWNANKEADAGADHAEELVFSHRVLSVKRTVDAEAGHHCINVQLEPLHAWELFSNVNVQALVEHPFDKSYVTVPEEQMNERALQFARPDSPLQACSAPAYATLMPMLNIAVGTTVRADPGKGCAMFQKDVPGSFAANFNVGSQRAAQQYTWGVITCDNCFAVLGAGVLAILNYEAGLFSGIKFLAQVKVVGNAGAAVSLKGKAGTASGSQSFNMANRGGAGATIPLGATGLKLKIAFGGASFKISGSATFAGSFSVAYGQLGALSVSGMYAGGFKFLKQASWRSLNKPFQNNNFRVTTWNVNGEVVARCNLQLSYGGALYANFNVFLGATATISSPTGGTGGKRDRLANLNLRMSTRRELLARGSAAAALADPATADAAAPVLVLRPGDEVFISHSYSGFNAGDEVELYYTLLSLSTGNEYAVLNKKLIVQQSVSGEAGDGAGAVEARWQVPSNLDFSRLGQTLESSFGGDVPSSLKDSAFVQNGVRGSDGEFAAEGNKATTESEEAVLALRQALEAAGADAGGAFVMRVRSNYFGDFEIATSDPVSFDAFTSAPDDGIFTLPAAKAHLPTDKPVQVGWKAEKLRRFEPGVHSWTGEDVATTSVNIDLVMEKLDSSSSESTVVVSSDTISLAKGVANNGQASVIFPSATTNGFDRFYLVVSDAEMVQAQGWSKGYFTLQRRLGQHEQNSRALANQQDYSPAKHSSHPVVAARRRLASAEATQLLTFDSRLLQDYESRKLFGGRVERPTIYEPEGTVEAALAAAQQEKDVEAEIKAEAASARDAVSADWWKRILDQSHTSSSRELATPVLGRKLLKNKPAPGSNCGGAVAPLVPGGNAPWKVAIWGGGGITTIGISILKISKQMSLNLEGRATIVTLTGTIAMPGIKGPASTTKPKAGCPKTTPKPTSKAAPKQKAGPKAPPKNAPKQKAGPKAPPKCPAGSGLPKLAPGKSRPANAQCVKCPKVSNNVCV